jgi:hypothetical protein
VGISQILRGRRKAERATLSEQKKISESKMSTDTLEGRRGEPES